MTPHSHSTFPLINAGSLLQIYLVAFSTLDSWRSLTPPLDEGNMIKGTSNKKQITRSDGGEDPRRPPLFPAGGAHHHDPQILVLIIVIGSRDLIVLTLYRIVLSLPLFTSRYLTLLFHLLSRYSRRRLHATRKTVESGCGIGSRDAVLAMI